MKPSARGGAFVEIASFLVSAALSLPSCRVTFSTSPTALASLCAFVTVEPLASAASSSTCSRLIAAMA